MAKILVTGASGFLGYATVSRLVDEGVQVVALDQTPPPKVFHNCEYIEGDVRDPNTIHRAAKDVESLIHFAAVNGTERFYSEAPEVLSVGLSGTINCIDAAVQAGVNNFFLASSSEVYHQPEIFPAAESLPCVVPDIKNPRFSYSVSKIASEALLFANAESFLRAIVFRPHNIYGPGMGDKHVVSQLAAKILQNPETLHLRGDGRQTRAFCYIDDFVNAMLILLQKGEHKEIYNVGSPFEIEIKEIAERLCRIAGVKLKFEFLQAPKGEPKRRCPDISKIRALGYFPKTVLDVGLARTFRRLASNLGVTQVPVNFVFDKSDRPNAYLGEVNGRSLTGFRSIQSNHRIQSQLQNSGYCWQNQSLKVEPAQGLNLYPLVFSDTPAQCMKYDFLFHLSERQIHSLNQGRTKVLLLFEKEGFCPYFDNNWFLWLHKGIADKGLEPSRIYYLTGNQIITESYARFCRDFSISQPIRTIGYPHLIEIMQRNILWQEPLPEANPELREKHFLFMNRRPYPHRTAAALKIFGRGLLKKSLWSFPGQQDYPEFFSDSRKHMAWLLDAGEESFLPAFNALLPKRLDVENIVDMEFRNINYDIFQRTYFSLIHETFFSDSIIFFTEKIPRAFAALHPFVLMAGPGYLGKLKAMGFKTFSPWINESYDSEPDTVKRYNMAVDETQRLCELSLCDMHDLYWKLMPVLQFNRHRFFTLENSTDKILTEFNDRPLWQKCFKTESLAPREAVLE